MTSFLKLAGILAIGAVIGFLGAPVAKNLGGTYEITRQYFAGGVNVGTEGSDIANVIKGTCNLSQSVVGSHAATTSKEYFCAVTGVNAGDLVFVGLPAGAGAYTSGSASIANGFAVNGAYATTTDRIGVSIANLSGAATSSIAQATTSVPYFIVR